MENFTPYTALLGGGLIGLSAFLLMWLNGRIAGISGIVGGLLEPKPGDVTWRVAFAAGLLLGGVAVAGFAPAWIVQDVEHSAVVWSAAGLLVGFGSRLGSGCTSGHGVCGLARLSRRSLASVLTFITTGVVTVTAVRMLGGN